MFLLDELKREKGVSRKKYTRLNNSLSESLDDAKEGEEEMGEDDGNGREMVVEGDDDDDDDDDEIEELTKIINSALDYVTQSDKKGTDRTIERAKRGIQRRRLPHHELIGTFLTDEFEDGKHVLPLINELITTLPTTSSSPISRSKQHKLKMLIDDINKNRYRIESIFRRLYEAEENELSILKGLLREDLLSDKQFEKLVELDVGN